jgi:hypothetical protein
VTHANKPLTRPGRVVGTLAIQFLLPLYCCQCPVPKNVAVLCHSPGDYPIFGVDWTTSGLTPNIAMGSPGAGSILLCMPPVRYVILAFPTPQLEPEYIILAWQDQNLRCVASLSLLLRTARVLPFDRLDTFSLRRPPHLLSSCTRIFFSPPFPALDPVRVRHTFCLPPPVTVPISRISRRCLESKGSGLSNYLGLSPIVTPLPASNRMTRT